MSSFELVVVGTGSFGSMLGRLWAQAGYRVTFATRDPTSARVRELAEAIGHGAQVASLADAGRTGDVLVLAVPWTAAEDCIRALGDIGGKVLVDVMNPVSPPFERLDVPPGSSAAQQVAAWAPHARVVKAFNTLGAATLDRPRYGEVAASMFLCGDDQAAKTLVAGLTAELGFEVIDAGGLSAAPLLESLALLWIRLAYHRNLGPDIAYKLLRR